MGRRWGQGVTLTDEETEGLRGARYHTNDLGLDPKGNEVSEGNKSMSWCNSLGSNPISVPSCVTLGKLYTLSEPIF